METSLEHILTNSYKAEMIAYLKAHPEDFDECIKLAISDKQPYSWRAAWILWASMDYNDHRLRKHMKKIIDILPSKTNGQLRELLLILQRMELKADYTGKVFNICVDVWEKLEAKPSIRFNAFRLMVKIAKKHPDLSDEIIYLTQFHYLDLLSKGVKKAILKMAADLKPNQKQSKSLFPIHP